MMTWVAEFYFLVFKVITLWEHLVTITKGLRGV